MANDGHDWNSLFDYLHAYVVAGTDVAADQVRWADQDAPRASEPGIILRLSVFDDLGMPWVDHKVNYITFADITVTAVDATANTLTKVAHGRLTGDGPVQMVGTDLPLNLVEARNYWIIKVDADKVKLALTFVDAMNGVAVDLGDVGSGTIQIIDTDRTLRAGQEIQYMARSTVRATLALECWTYEGVGANMATAVLNRLRARSALPSQRQRLYDLNVGLSGFDRIFALMGTRDAFLYEPRASLNMQLTLPSEVTEYGDIIERVRITNELADPDHTWTVDGG